MTKPRARTATERSRARRYRARGELSTADRQWLASYDREKRALVKAREAKTVKRQRRERGSLARAVLGSLRECLASAGIRCGRRSGTDASAGMDVAQPRGALVCSGGPDDFVEGPVLEVDWSILGRGPNYGYLASPFRVEGPRVFNVRALLGYQRAKDSRAEYTWLSVFALSNLPNARQRLGERFDEIASVPSDVTVRLHRLNVRVETLASRIGSRPRKGHTPAFAPKKRRKRKV